MIVYFRKIAVPESGLSVFKLRHYMPMGRTAKTCCAGRLARLLCTGRKTDFTYNDDYLIKEEILPNGDSKSILKNNISYKVIRRIS